MGLISRRAVYGPGDAPDRRPNAAHVLQKSDRWPRKQTGAAHKKKEKKMSYRRMDVLVTDGSRDGPKISIPHPVPASFPIAPGSLLLFFLLFPRF